jgi:molybdopterin-guanine dinucleotide biosynthesis protein A
MRDLESIREGLPNISGLILAGGAGRRSGGRDKGLISWQGRPLMEHVVERIRPQTRSLQISCNRNRDRYRQWAPVTPADLRTGYQGPLAGLEAARGSLVDEYVLIVPCDMPLLPHDLAVRLWAAMRITPGCQVSYACVNDRGQYLCALIQVSCLHTLPAYLDDGQRTVRHWYQQLDSIAVEFDDQRDNFLNLNALTSDQTT